MYRQCVPQPWACHAKGWLCKTTFARESGWLDDPSARHDRRSLCMLSWSWIGGVPFIHLKTERWPWILYTSWLEASEADGCKGWFDKRIWIWWQSWQQYWISRSFACAQWGKKGSHKTVRYNSPVLMLWMHETTVQCITAIEIFPVLYRWSCAALQTDVTMIRLKLPQRAIPHPVPGFMLSFWIHSCRDTWLMEPLPSRFVFFQLMDWFKVQKTPFHCANKHQKWQVHVYAIILSTGLGLFGGFFYSGFP